MERTRRLQARRLKHSLIMLGCVALAAVALFPSPAMAQSEVRGEVLDKKTVRPIASAEVTLVDFSGMIAGQSLSDSIGAFVMEIEAGEYQVFVTRDGCETSDIGIIDVTARSDLVLNIQLEPDLIMRNPASNFARHGSTELSGARMRSRRPDRNWGEFLQVLQARGCVR